MRVTKPESRASRRASSSAGAPVVLWVGLLLLAFGLGFLARREGWQRPLLEAATSLLHDPGRTVRVWRQQAAVPQLTLDVAFADLQTLAGQRERAWQRGVSVPVEAERVPATVSYGGDSFPVALTLPAGSAALLFAEDIWAFDGLATAETPDGLVSFTLTRADADFLATWGYLESLRRAGLPAARLRLVRLMLNGADEGLYAWAEVPTGVEMVGFDVESYAAAAARLQELLPADGFRYTEKTVPAMGEAARRLAEVRAGALSPDAAFDVEATGRFLALTALWRGTATLDWRAARWTLAPSTRRLAPVGVISHWTPVAPLPPAFFDDVTLQATYAQSLAELSRPEALAEAQAILEPSLEPLRLALGLPPDAPWDLLAAHQRAMQALLAPPQPLFAYVGTDGDALTLRLGNVSPLPLAIVGVDVGEGACVTLDPAWVAAEDRARLLDVPGEVVLPALLDPTPDFVRLRLPSEALTAGGGEIHVRVRVYGLAGPEVTVTAMEEP